MPEAPLKDVLTIGLDVHIPRPICQNMQHSTQLSTIVRLDMPRQRCRKVAAVAISPPSSNTSPAQRCRLIVQASSVSINLNPATSCALVKMQEGGLIVRLWQCNIEGRVWIIRDRDSSSIAQWSGVEWSGGRH